MESYEAVRLVAAERGRAAEVLLAAFVDDPPNVYVCPDREERERALRRFLGAVVSFAVRFGVVYTTPDLRGVACWLSLRGASVPFWQMVMTGFALPRAVLSLEQESRRRMGDIMQYNDNVHKEVLMQERHWYLGALGVLPECQRQGIGGRLLQPMLARSDAEGRPCYLETQNEPNVRFYERHGFQVVRSGEVPGHGVKMWGMLRRPLA